MFDQVGIIVKSDDHRVRDALRVLLNCLRRRGAGFLCDAACAEYLPEEHLELADQDEMGRRCQLVVVLGGDGTLLRAARNLAIYRLRLLGINLGRLGFLTDISPCDIHKHLEAILAGEFTEENRFLLSAEAWRAGEKLAGGDAFNDVVLHKWNTAHMFSFQTWVDGHFVGEQRADGLIVSTPTGSTAYGLSVGGPILHPNLDALLMVFICPHSLSNRPIVLHSDSQIEIALTTRQFDTAQMTCDGILCQELQPGDRVIIRRHQEIILVHPPGHDYYAILRAKLHWGRSG